MKDLTIRQPYADAIVHVDHPQWGRKRIENRSWPAPGHLVGARILIHAGRTGDRRAVLAGIHPGPDARGAIIGTARVTGCHFAGAACRLKDCGPWAEPEIYHWQFANVTALPEPVPAKGRLRLWTPLDDVLDAVQQQLASAGRPA